MTKKLMVGKVAVGGGAPVSIQSMCNTKTDDVAATVAQIHALEDAGCEIIRVAVPDEDAAKAVDKIKEQIDISLIADIHFNYKLALMCAERDIDALRINPGNIGGEEKVKAAAADLAAVYGVVQIVFERPMGESGIFTGYFDPVVMTMVAGGHVVGELALHRGKHTVAADVSSAGGVVDEHKIIGEAGAQSVPILLVKAIPVIRLETLYCTDVLLYLNAPFELAYALFEFFHVSHRLYLFL